MVGNGWRTTGAVLTLILGFVWSKYLSSFSARPRSRQGLLLAADAPLLNSAKEANIRPVFASARDGRDKSMVRNRSAKIMQVTVGKDWEGGLVEETRHRATSRC